MKEAQPTQEINELLQTQQELGEIQAWIEARKSAQVYLTREEAAVCVHAYTHKLRAELEQVRQERDDEKRCRAEAQIALEKIANHKLQMASNWIVAQYNELKEIARRALEGE